jgi:hypothetical protein
MVRVPACLHACMLHASVACMQVQAKRKDSRCYRSGAVPDKYVLANSVAWRNRESSVRLGLRISHVEGIGVAPYYHD